MSALLAIPPEYILDVMGGGWTGFSFRIAAVKLKLTAS